ncbi:MAG TPA: GNAT family N-acetyltransferase [Edaphobacter sp.]|nr:GNAT family N-acetyltransferase [Edaphobacter sp.]
MSTKTDVISAADPLWDNLLELVPHDVYHTRAYHANSKLEIRDSCLSRNNADYLLFSYRRDEMVFLFPFVLRTLDDIPGCSGSGYFDVTSVYGYGGPLASRNASCPFIEAAWRELFEVWKAHGVVSAFTRFHPLLDNVHLTQILSGQLSGLGGLSSTLCGATVSIDLRRPEAEQFQQYQKNLRAAIRKCYAQGFEVITVDLTSAADLFVDLYTQSMRRRNASEQYLIDRNWLLRFSRALSANCFLLVARLNGEAAAAMLVMEYRGYVHAHLAGIDERFTDSSPLKPLLDGTRKWSTARGNHTFHLGGGIGGRQDSLFQFKQHFSRRTHPFHIGCWVLNHEVYRSLSAEQLPEAVPLEDSSCTGIRPFPAYRFASPVAVAD